MSLAAAVRSEVNRRILESPDDQSYFTLVRTHEEPSSSIGEYHECWSAVQSSLVYNDNLIRRSILEQNLRRTSYSGSSNFRFSSYRPRKFAGFSSLNH